MCGQGSHLVRAGFNRYGPTPHRPGDTNGRVLLVAAVIAAACGSSAENGEELTSASGSATPAAIVEQIEPSPPDVTVSGLAIHRGEEIDGAPEPLVDLDEIRSGGPPPDGIPSIDDPTFLRGRASTSWRDNEPVLALEIDGDARAYPVQIMTWHEIVNDTVGGVPVAVSYCPLCNSAVAYDRRLDDRVLDFGTSGLLCNSALVMYDRQTETLWSHFTGEGIIGELTGEDLDTLPAGDGAVGRRGEKPTPTAWCSAGTPASTGRTAATRTPATTTSTASRSSSKARSTAATPR